MCAATAAAVGTAVAAVAAVGTQVAGAVSGPKGGGAASATPQTKPIPGFGPATGLQSYTARLLAANKGVRTPGILEWAASGGTLRPDWKVPDLTPKEAGQLGFVDKKTGKPIPGYSTDIGGPLSPAAQAYRGRQRAQALQEGGFKTQGQDPQIRYGQLAAREEMLQTKIAEKGEAAPPGLSKRLAKVTARKERVGKRLGL